MGSKILNEDGTQIELEEGGKLLQEGEGSDDDNIGLVFFAVKAFIKTKTGKYQLNSASGRPIKIFDNIPTEKEIKEARQENGY